MTIFTDRKVGVGGIVLALLMLLFMFRPVVVGFGTVAEYSFESALLFACALAWSITGCVTVVSALWLLGSRGRSHFPMLIGGSAIVVTGAIFATSAATHLLPCGGPD